MDLCVGYQSEGACSGIGRFYSFIAGAVGTIEETLETVGFRVPFPGHLGHLTPSSLTFFICKK